MPQPSPNLRVGAKLTCTPTTAIYRSGVVRSKEYGRELKIGGYNDEEKKTAKERKI